MNFWKQLFFIIWITSPLNGMAFVRDWSALDRLSGYVSGVLTTVSNTIKDFFEGISDKFHPIVRHERIYKDSGFERSISSIWQKAAQGNTLSGYQKNRLFADDCAQSAYLNRIIPRHQTGDKRSFRIATYNIHYWTDPFRRASFDRILEVIREINADVLILQEFIPQPGFKASRREANDFWKKIEGLGYRYHFFKEAVFLGVPFGNAILLKYPAEIEMEGIFEEKFGQPRSYLYAKVILPNKKPLNVYGTHLDVYDKTGLARERQTNELIKIIDQERENIILGADFNAVRRQDYQYMVDEKSVWGLLTADFKERTGLSVIPTGVHDRLIKSGFVDSFSQAHQSVPRFTVWSGVTIDFLYLKNWELPILGCYVYYSAASDHLPVIMDVDILGR